MLNGRREEKPLSGMATKKLEWFPEGERKPPVTILGDDMEKMLVVLAIIQAPIPKSFDRYSGLQVHPVDQMVNRKKPIKLNIKLK